MSDHVAPELDTDRTSARRKPIQGVATSTCGMVGPTRSGPVGGAPNPITTFTEFEHIYGSLDRLRFAPPGAAGEGEGVESENYLAHAARAFFGNGGSRLYVSRIFTVPAGADDDYGRAYLELDAGFALSARFPGGAGNMDVIFQARIGEDVLQAASALTGPRLAGVQELDVVFVGRAGSPAAAAAGPFGFFDVVRADEDGWLLARAGGDTLTPADLAPGADAVHPVSVLVSTRANGNSARAQPFGEFALHPDRNNSLVLYFQEAPRVREQSMSLPLSIRTDHESGAAIARLLFPDLENALRARHEANPPGTRRSRRDEADDARGQARAAAAKASKSLHTLAGGHDGLRPGAADYEGHADRATGLAALEAVDDISLIAAPGYSSLYAAEETAAEAAAVEQLLLAQAEKLRHRFAILDCGPGMSIEAVRGQRARIDSPNGALYYPWITVADPAAADQRLNLPPSGFVAGIFARNDARRGVHHAPANVVARGAVELETHVGDSEQDLLNPQGINAFRLIENRGFRLWGARTLSSEPEWKYVHARRYFCYLERSLELGTAWVAFQENGPELWADVVRDIEEFMLTEWLSGALQGSKSDEAFFVRCDTTTMTEDDIRDGRLICLVGFALFRPAEFTLVRIRQSTAVPRQ